MKDTAKRPEAVPLPAPKRMLPYPSAIYLRALAGNLQDAAPGDVGLILRALRVLLTDVDYTLARTGDAEGDEVPS